MCALVTDRQLGCPIRRQIAHGRGLSPRARVRHHSRRRSPPPTRFHGPEVAGTLWSFRNRSVRLSKLSDKIKSVTKMSSTPIGFGSTRAADEATMVLLGFAKDVRDAAEMAKRGADAVVVSGAKPEAGKELSSTIAGASTNGKTEGESTAYHEGGFDFVVFDPNHASATALQDEKVGYILTLPHDFEESEIRTLEAFQLDAIDIGSVEGALTVRRQIDLRRTYAMTHKPLLAHIKGDISMRELQALRDTSVVLVAVDRVDDVERLRKTIDSLPPRPRRRDGDDRPMPFVPRPTAGDGDEEDDHDH